MRVSALQLDVVRGDVAANLDAVEEGLRAAAAQRVDLLVLPEMWPTSFPDPTTDLRAALAASEEAVARAARLAGELGVLLCGSSFGAPEGWECDEGQWRPTNRLQVFDGGRCVLSYDKVHLFSPTAEGEGFCAGKLPPQVADTRLGRIAGIVCYDLRFPELTRVPFRAGAELIVVPAQWPRVRAAQMRALAAGLAAVDQCFVVVANRTGSESVGRRSLQLDFPGNSVVAAPDGTLVAEGAGEPGLVVADIDLAAARELRAKVPVARDQRCALYASWEEESALSAGF